MMERMPPSRGRYIAVAVFVLALTFSPYAHAAETSAVGINDPFTDAIQLWSAALSSLDSLAHQIASAVQLHQTLTFNATAKPHVPNNPQQPAALAASAALATESPPETATTLGHASNGATTPQQPQTTSPPGALSHQTIQSPFVKSPELKSSAFAAPTPATNFVTQTQFNAALSLLGTSVQQLLAQSNPNPFPEYVAGDGNNLNPYAAVSNIRNLSNVIITNPTITGLSAGEIPDLSGSYLSLGGGTLTGAFVDTATASSSFAGALGIGTTSPSDVLAVQGPYFLGNVTPTATTNRLYSNAGSLYWAGSLIGGGSVGNWTTDGTNVWRAGGNVGIGTTSPFATVSIVGSGYLTGSLTASSLSLTSALPISSGGTGTTTAAAAVLGLGLPDYYAANAGVKCDGVTDDTSAINSALTHVGNVILPMGTCVISGSLNVPSNTYLHGSGIGVTTVKTPANPGYAAIKFAQTVSSAGVSDLSINGNSSGAGIRTSDGVFAVDGSSHIKVYRVEVYGTADNGIEVNGNNSEVAFNYVHDNYTNGIYDIGTGGTGARSQYNWIRNNDVENNSVGTKGWDGIDVDPNTAYTTIQDNLVVGNDIILYESGSSVASSYGHAISDNTIMNSIENGIDLTGYLTDIVVSGNRIFNVDGAGVFLNSPINNLQITGNYIDGTSYGTYSYTEGILVANGSYTDTPSNIEIDDNTIKDVGTNSGTGPAILIQSGTTHYHMEDNTVTDDRSPVILTYSADVSGASTSGDLEDNSFISGTNGVINAGSNTPTIVNAGTGGNFGIGTTTPTASFSVAGNLAPGSISQSSILSEPVPTITSNPGSNPGVPGIIFNDSGEPTPTGVGGIFSSYFGTNVVGGLVDGMTFISPRDLDNGYSGNANWGFRFNSQSGSTRMFIDTASGNIGIGTTSPGSILSAQGVRLDPFSARCRLLDGSNLDLLLDRRH
jgi:Right handed beta helix region